MDGVAGGALGARLSEETLARRAGLPLKPAPVELTGERVRLSPLDLGKDAGPLFEATDGWAIRVGEREVGAYDPDALVWRYLFAGPFAGIEEFRAYLRGQVDAPDGLCLCVRERATDRPIGVVNLMNNAPAHLKVELGGIFYGPVAQRTGANLEATYLLLGYLFGLGYRRIEWKCNALNERSRRAALGMGFAFEGIQEAHMVVKGRNRDTAWFRMLNHEWPERRARLEARLRGEA
ncbi:MAG: GNAT family N-acetyltransferase [Chloroflexota bacterium]|nr:GNAT family N-acetyltransferase [Chloroflexota bacterium]